MRAVTRGAALANRIMREDEWTALLCVALHAGVVHGGNLSSSTFHGRPFMRIVTTRATHLHAVHWVSEWHAELGFGVQVALVTTFGVALHVDDSAGTTPCFDVQAAWAVAGLTPDLGYIRALGYEASVIGGLELLNNLLVASRAFFRTHELSTRNSGRSHDRAARAGA